MATKFEFHLVGDDHEGGVFSWPKEVKMRTKILPNRPEHDQIIVFPPDAEQGRIWEYQVISEALDSEGFQVKEVATVEAQTKPMCSYCGVRGKHIFKSIPVHSTDKDRPTIDLEYCVKCGHPVRTIP